MKTIFISLGIFLVTSLAAAQDNTEVQDLSKLDYKDWEVINRQASFLATNNETYVEFNSQENDGIAWLKDFEFNNGTIEADIKGKDVQGASFVGIAFRGEDDETYDAVYFRPFNFRSEDPVRIGHAVQYISMPEYTWKYLREEHPEEYENPVDPSPDPNSFFHAKIVVEKPKISVFVNNSEEPCLVVNELSNRKGGKIGLWVGNYSDGTFKNIKITFAK